MSTKYFTANVISASKVVPDGNFETSAASGVWDLSEQYDLRRGGNWPETGNAAPLGIFVGGRNTSNAYVSDYEKIIISTAGDGTDYGDLTAVRRGSGCLANGTRGIFVAGSNSSNAATNEIEYIAILSGGTAQDFGDLAMSAARHQYIHGCLSNATRGCVTPATNNVDTIEYVTIGTLGNSTDFGNLSVDRFNNGTAASTTRGIIYSGDDGSRSNVIDYITIGSTGNATDFGNATTASYAISGLASSTRGCFSLGNVGSGGSGAGKQIDYITIASTGNAADFGDLVNNKLYPQGSSPSSSTRGVFAIDGDFEDAVVGAAYLDFITIASTGNATSFGNLSIQNGIGVGGTSNVHGGL